MRQILAVVLLLAAVRVSAGEVLQPGAEGDWSSYDFVPGDKVLFYEDFSGKAPLKRLKDATPRLDVQEIKGRKWLHCRPPCGFDVLLPEKLPARFTVDFDFKGGDDANQLQFRAVNADGSEPDGGSPWAASSPSSMSFGESNSEINRVEGIGQRKELHFSWVFDGKEAKAYAVNTAALNAPGASMPRTARLRFEFVGGDDPTLIDRNVPLYVTSLRVAGGGNAVSFDELSKKGRITLNGILFDTGSDRIRPESTATLAAVAKMLVEHHELRLVVEGHTDDQGVPAANLALSAKRAAAVKAWLVDKHRVDPARLEPKGFGQEKPAASNATAEGRQANRRVELSQP